LGALRSLLLIIGIAALGYCGYALVNQYVYQAYENWAFDQQIARPPVASATPRPIQGAVLGRVEIGRLNLSAIVREGVDTKTLSVAVGHVPATTLPGQPGNFVIAAHRDTLFRALKDIKKDDLVTMQTATGSSYTYRVVATKIVKPTDVSVLGADGGGLIDVKDSNAPPRLLTMITCYPFYYVGAAPKRFIVEAELVSESGRTNAPNGRA
jgi:sortase A